MLIDKILPQVVAVKGSLRERLAAEGAAIGMAEGDTATLLAAIRTPVSV